MTCTYNMQSYEHARSHTRAITPMHMAYGHFITLLLGVIWWNYPKQSKNKYAPRKKFKINQNAEG